MAIGKQDVLITELRNRIRAGRLRPGDRLPPRSILESEFQVSSVTLQRAMDSLSNDGFIESRGRQGTLVAPHPPHLHHYGLMFPKRPTKSSHLRRSWKVITDVARELLDTHPNRLSIFYRGDSQQSIKEYQTFLEDVAAHRLAGLIVPATPIPHLPDLISVSNDTLPIVAYASGNLPGVAMTKGATKMMDKMLDYLQACGCKRVGQLLTNLWYETKGNEEEFSRLLSERGMRSKTCWLQNVHPRSPQFARNAAELLAASTDGPDAIILQDDNLVEEVIAGIRAAGKRIPEDIRLVVWGNFPWPDSYTAPIKRFGVDIYSMVARAKEYIDARRAGKNPENVIVSHAIEGLETQERRLKLNIQH